MSKANYKDLIAFHNIGNSCYLNTALQALLSCSEFRECVVVCNKEKNTNKLLVPFLNILNEIVQKKDDSDTPISNPILLKQMLSDYNSFFKDYNQQDCHECIINILDIIHENTKSNDPILITNDRVLKKIPGLVKEANKEWKELMEKTGLSFTNYLFSGQLRSNLICSVCNKERNNFEITNNISLSLPNEEKVDIIDCFQNFFVTEILSNQNAVHCDYCKTKTNTKKSLSLWRFPKILILHLKRYTQNPNGSYSRNNCLVEFSPELMFREKSNNKKNKLVYNLQCVVNHFGYTPMGGHYTSIVRHNGSDYDWVHIDDSNIFKATEEQIVTKAAYILIYKLI